eukprot:6152941-Amphidinium_carterae.1
MLNPTFYDSRSLLNNQRRLLLGNSANNREGGKLKTLEHSRTTSALYPVLYDDAFVCSQTDLGA